VPSARAAGYDPAVSSDEAVTYKPAGRGLDIASAPVQGSLSKLVPKPSAMRTPNELRALVRLALAWLGLLLASVSGLTRVEAGRNLFVDDQKPIAVSAPGNIAAKRPSRAPSRQPGFSSLEDDRDDKYRAQNAPSVLSGPQAEIAVAIQRRALFVASICRTPTYCRAYDPRAPPAA
jgi:hypothetical protein